MGHDTEHWEGVGRVSPQGGQQAYRGATLAREGGHVEIPPNVVRDDGSGTSGGGNLRLLLLERSRTVYCNQPHYEPVYGGGADTRAMGLQEVMVAVQV